MYHKCSSVIQTYYSMAAIDTLYCFHIPTIKSVSLIAGMLMHIDPFSVIYT